jgi:hypothetical protein
VRVEVKATSRVAATSPARRQVHVSGDEYKLAKLHGNGYVLAFVRMCDDGWVEVTFFRNPVALSKARLLVVRKDGAGRSIEFKPDVLHTR